MLKSFSTHWRTTFDEDRLSFGRAGSQREQLQQELEGPTDVRDAQTTPQLSDIPTLSDEDLQLGDRVSRFLIAG
jgi:hypothetical protein